MTTSTSRSRSIASLPAKTTWICQDRISPYLIIQRQFEDDDGGVCYIETHDHDAYAGHFRLRLIEFTATRLAFEIARAKDKYVDVTDALDAKQLGEVQRIVHIVFGVQG